MKTLVPDTNFWLHARMPFDFKALAGPDDLVVAVPLTVVDEIDRRKDLGSRQIRSRAREVIRWLRPLLEGSDQRDGRLEVSADGVAYWFLPPVPGLYSSDEDDRIVETAKQLKEVASTVELVTADAGMEIRARMAGVSVLRVPPELLVADELDPLEKEVARLIDEVNKLKKGPILEVAVEANVVFPEDSAIPELRRIELPSDDELAEYGAAIPTRMARQKLGWQTDPGLAGYHSALPGYANSVVSYLREMALWESLGEAFIRVDLLITNRSMAPVEDALLEVFAPPGVTFVFDAVSPKPPVPPKPAMDAALEQVLGLRLPSFPGIGASLLVPPLRPVSTFGPRIRIERTWVESRVNEPLRPQHQTFAGKMSILLEPSYPDEDIRLPFRVYAATSGPPATGTLVVKVRHRREKWPLPELPSAAYPDVKLEQRQTAYQTWLLR